jgi:hypothetical protein
VDVHSEGPGRGFRVRVRLPLDGGTKPLSRDGAEFVTVSLRPTGGTVDPATN